MVGPLGPEHYTLSWSSGVSDGHKGVGDARIIDSGCEDSVVAVLNGDRTGMRYGCAFMCGGSCVFVNGSKRGGRKGFVVMCGMRCSVKNDAVLTKALFVRGRCAEVGGHGCRRLPGFIRCVSEVCYMLFRRWQ